MALASGEMLQERYRVVALLGQGGMGAVYRAWDTRLGVAVALKEMTPEPGLDQARLLAAREQFHQEASVLSRLNHTHLVRVSDFFDEGGSTYLVMAFVEGESLAAHISRVGAVNETQALAWADQLLDALAYCHREGVLHRDIKPQNVILRPDGSVVLVDFGLVKLWNPNDPRTRTVIRSMGTPQYAPPEQYEPQIGHTDPRSDLYSLGATLYHALTGQAPPTATTRIVNPGALVPARQYNAGVSTRVEWALERAMALQPDARFQTAEEMRQSLGGASAARASEMEKTKVMNGGASAPIRRFPLGIAGIVIAAVLVCGGVVGIAAGVAYWISNRDGTATSEVLTQDDEPTSLAPGETRNPTNTPESKVIPGASPTTPASATLPPTPTTRPSSTPEPTPSNTPTPSVTPTPSLTPTPSCPQVSGPFAGVWQAHRDELGCAQGGAYDSWVAQEHFESGMMTWRQDNDRIYAHYANGVWASYADIWAEGEPDFSCGTPQNPPTPMRGFGKIWCTYDAVRNGLGNATGPEVGQTAILQMFDRGFALRSQSGDDYVFLNSGQWWVE
ncbi:MAG: serine/threonine protein kinase [Anaerolineae bacterium]|nr:serine/threonine protein kinase [Anaerolineae bacterium]